jgi:hypothetical protein
MACCPSPARRALSLHPRQRSCLRSDSATQLSRRAGWAGPRTPGSSRDGARSSKISALPGTALVATALLILLATGADVGRAGQEPSAHGSRRDARVAGDVRRGTPTRGVPGAVTILGLGFDLTLLALSLLVGLQPLGRGVVADRHASPAAGRHGLRGCSRGHRIPSLVLTGPARIVNIS